MLFQLPPRCRVFTKIEPALQWGWAETFHNKIAYLLELIVWQNAAPPADQPGKRAQWKSVKPQLFTPSFMPKSDEVNPIKKDTVAADVDTIKEILSRPRG